MIGLVSPGKTKDLYINHVEKLKQVFNLDHHVKYPRGHKVIELLQELHQHLEDPV